MNQIYSKILELKKNHKKAIALLIDPDKWNNSDLLNCVSEANQYEVDFIFVGGSLATTENIHNTIKNIKQNTSIPVVLFPGTPIVLDKNADGVLLLSLISGRNPDFLIGRHVENAHLLSISGLEILPTSYLLIDGGKATTVNYISNTQPLPNNKPEIILATALAGQQLGQKLTYLDCGSGAVKPLEPKILECISQKIKNPIIVGGGINSGQQAKALFLAGADLLVIGHAIENNKSFLKEVCGSRDEAQIMVQA